MKRWLLFALFLCAVWPASTEAAKPKNLSFSCALATGGTTCLGDYPIAGGDNDGFSGVSALADTDAARVLAVVAGVPKVCDYVFDADDATTATDSSDTTGCPAAVRGYDASWSAGVWLLASYTVKGLTVARVAGSASATDFYEVPANGDNKVTLKPADSLAGDYTVTLPSATGTLSILGDNVWTGAQDFGGATSVEIPNGASPTVDAAGEIAIDTTSDQLQYYGSTKIAIPPKRFFSVVVPSVADTDDMFILKLPWGITVTALDCIVSAATSATINIQECGSDGTSCTDMATSDLACDTDGANTTTLNNAAADAGDWLKLDVASISGTPGTLTVTVTYTVTPD